MTEEVATPETKGGYNPQAAIAKVAQIQDKFMDVIMAQDAEKLLDDPKKMEQINSLLANVNTTAVQVTRNSIVESNSDHAALADAIADRMAAKGISTIRTVESSGGARGNIPTGLVIDDADFEDIQDGMLQRGLVDKTYDEFAGENGLRKTDD